MSFSRVADGNHAATRDGESAAYTPIPWEAWVAEVEQLLGHDVDGDQVVDGYSLGFTHKMFRAGRSTSQAAAAIATNITLAEKRRQRS